MGLTKFTNKIIMKMTIVVVELVVNSISSNSHLSI